MIHDAQPCSRPLELSRANGIRKFSGYSIESMEFVESGDFRFVMSYDVQIRNATRVTVISRDFSVVNPSKSTGDTYTFITLT